MKIIRRFTLVSICLCLLFACGNKNQESTDQTQQAPSNAFLRTSDPAAVQLIDSVVSASGGMDAWMQTHFISWNVSGERDIYWDKKNGKVKVVSTGSKSSYLLDLNQRQGKMKQEGQLISDDGKISEAFKRWKEDSTDLFFPFNLNHPNYQVVYLGEEEMADGKKANVVELHRMIDSTLAQRAYKIMIDQKENLIVQVVPHDPAGADSLGQPTTFDNYKKYGTLMLSANRSSGKGPRDVKIESSVPEEIFEEF
jgi:hypothetical protein